MDNVDTVIADVQLFREAFEMFDFDKSGAIDVSELQTLLTVVGMDGSEGAVNDIVTEMDVDGSGEIEVEEFLAIMTRYRKSLAEEVRQSFQAIDVDGDGCIEPDELKAMLEKVGIIISDNEVAEMFAAADNDGDNKIDFSEFTQAYGKMGWEKTRELGKLLNDLKNLWAILDEDGSGTVDVDEIVALFTQLGIEIAVGDAQDILIEADLDGDGELSWQEFITAYHGPKWKKVSRYFILHAMQ